MLEGLRLACRRVQAIAGLALAIALALGTANAQKAISFVQVNSTTPSKQSSVTVSYITAQTVGDLNVVVVGWNDSTAKISSIADSAGNTYAVAVGPTVQSGTATQAIYYAKNIVAAAANSNSVTVRFSAAANYPDLRIAEYAGLDPSNPVDVAVAATGTSTSGSSGSVTTTNANDLLVGANLVQTTTSGAGTGYTNRVITTPDGDILEDRIVTTTGKYSATASISPSGKWIMQMVAFRAAATGAGMTPNITSMSPGSGPVGTSVTITGTNFGSTQGISTVTFNGTTGSPTRWSATSIAVPVPSGATTGNVVVTVSGLGSNGVNFTVTATSPNITSLNPSSGPVGTSVTIAGTNFGSTQGTNTVTFNGTVTTPTSWSATSIVAQVPSGAGTGNVVVTVGGVASNGVAFTVTTTSPSITGLSPSSGPMGTSVTIAGTNFGSTQGTSTVTFNGIVATPTSWSATSIVVPVPIGATTGYIVVTVGGAASNGAAFTVTTTGPSITSLSPNSGPVGTSVTITGTNFGSTQGTSTVTFNGTAATPTSWSATSIVAPVPIGATTGNVVVTVAGQASNGVSFTVTTTSPSITSLNPSSAPVGTAVTIAGTNFGSTQGTSTVTFNGIVATPTSWSATSIAATVPSGATTGNVVVTVSGLASNGVTFTVSATSPNITGLNPTSGSVGTSVTIAGTNFGSAQGTSTVTFNGAVAMPTSWSATNIAATVPSGATTGNVAVTVGGQASNGVSFTVTATSPNITGLNPGSGPVGTSVTIAGTNFGSTQGTSTVTFNGTTASPTNWSATTISVPEPSGATTGNVVLTVGGLASNGMSFTVTNPAAISFVQVSSAVPATPQTSVTATYTKTQTAGDLNVVVVGWNDSTATISSVADSAGNAYSLAVGPTVQSGTATQAIYYAKNIVAAAANSNNVTVTFSAAASYPDLRIAEYSGLDPSNPADVAVAGSGSSTSSSSGSATTTNANDLLVGANLVQTTTTAAGTGYTNRVITTPDGDILEDRVVTTTGSYSATASVSPSGKWIMQMAAFRAASNGAGTSLNISSASPSSGPVGTSVTIAGTNFGSSQGTSRVTFNGIVATPTSWSATSIRVPVPIGSTTGYIVVTVGGAASNGAAFTVTTTGPSITSLSPNSGPVGTSVTITGTNFGSSQGTSTVTFNGIVATPTSWSATSIAATLPSGATTGNVVVTVAGQASNGVSFTVTTTNPSITSLSPGSGPVGTVVTIAGTNFGSAQGTSTVTFNGTVATPTSWSATSIAAPVPSGAGTGNVVVTVGGQASNGASFTVSIISSGGPTLIQHVSSSNTRGIDLASPFCYYFQLPNPTTSGNAVIVGATFGSNSTPTVTDDQGDSYTIVENYYDSADNQSVAIAAAFNVSPGARNISVCFNADPGGWVQPMATEFNNVVAVDGSGTASEGTGTSVTAGTLTPTVGGDLTYQVVFGTSANQSSFTAGSQGNITWNLLSADLMDGWAGQYGVYDSTSAINPTMSMGTGEKWLSAAILLQVGTAGSVPSGMRIVHLVHENLPVHEASGGDGSFPNPMPLQFPSSGNLLVAMIGGGYYSDTVTSITDRNNNTWIQAGSTFVIADNDTVQTYFAGNATSSGDLGLTVKWGGASGDFTILFYDVTGAAISPLDTTNGATDIQSSTSGTLTVPYTLTPAQPGELIFTNIIWDANTGTGLTSNTGTSYFDTNMFSGESLSGPEPVDENNGWGHVISTSTGPINFTWSQLSTTLPAGNWASMAVAFLPGDPPGN